MFLGIRKVLILALLMISMITFLVVCFGFSIITLSKAKIISQDNYVFSIENINFEFGKKFSHVRLKIYKCTLQDLNTGQDFEIVSDAYFSLNLNTIYESFKNTISGEEDSTIFHFHVNGIDFDAISNFNKKRNSNNQSLVVLQNHNGALLKNITDFLNKYYIKNLRLSLQFKAFNLNKLETINNRLNKNLVSIQKISFSTVDGDHKYIGNVKINYSLNNTTNSLSLLFVRQSEKIADIKAKIYGFLNSNIQLRDGIVININDFIGMSFSYDFDDRLLLFDGNFNKISLDYQEFFTKPIEVIDGKFGGFYDYDTGIYDIQNINFSLFDSDKKYRFIGGISHNKFFELSLSAVDVINSKLVLDYWPIKFRGALHNILAKIIYHGYVKDTKFSLRIFPGSKGTYANELKLDLKIIDPRLHYTTYDLSASEINLSLDEKKASIKANQAIIDGILHASDIDVKIPFVGNDKANIKFDFSCSGNAIDNLFKKESSKKTGLVGGLISGNIKVDIPNKNNLQLYDLSVRTKTSLKNISFQNKIINSKNLELLFEHGKIFAKSDFVFDEIRVENLRFEGDISRDESFNINSIHFRVPLSQNKIQSISEKIQLKVDGNLIISVAKNNKFKLNLSEVSLDPKFGIKKEIGEFGEVEFRLEDKILKDIKLILPDINLQGQVEFDDDKIVSADLNVEKFHSSKFNLKFNIDNEKQYEYLVEADKIDLPDIKKILAKDNVKRSYEGDDLKISKVVVRAKSLDNETKNLMSDVDLFFILHSNKLLKVDGSGYIGKNGYVRVFFDEPVVALIINNTGYFLKNSFNINSLNKGNLELYGVIDEKDKKLQFSGELYTYNFKLLESYLLSTILKIYSVSGFSVMNIFQMFSKGINFSSMHCFIDSDDKSILFDKCQAFSDTMLLSIEARLGLDGKKGKIEGLIIPKTILNTPVILLQKFLSKKGKTLLDGMDDKQNFSISWNGDEKPIINTNPISFILPSIFSNLFSKNKTIKDQQQS